MSEKLTDKQKRKLELYWDCEDHVNKKIFVNLQGNIDRMHNEAKVVCDLMSTSVLSAHQVFVESYSSSRILFDYQISYYFDGQVDWYLGFLAKIIPKTRVLLINVFLDYVNNRSKVLKMTEKERERYATEFAVNYFTEERNFYSRKNFADLLILTDNQLDLLNSMLKIAEQKEISKEVIYSLQKVKINI